MSTEMRKFLLTSACGQIGSDLVIELRKKYSGVPCKYL